MNLDAPRAPDLVAQRLRRSSRSGSSDQLPLQNASEYAPLSAHRRPSASELLAAGDLLSPGIPPKLAETAGSRRSSLQAPKSDSVVHRMHAAFASVIIRARRNAFCLSTQ
jgi:hypothetical protein